MLSSFCFEDAFAGRVLLGRLSACPPIASKLVTDESSIALGLIDYTGTTLAEFMISSCT